MKTIAFVFLVALIGSYFLVGGQADDSLMDSTFRIDIKNINLKFDYDLNGSGLHIEAEVKFRMRKGQKQPVFHFQKLSSESMRRDIDLLALNGEDINPENSALIRILDVKDQGLAGFEIVKRLEEGVEHTLRLKYKSHDHLLGVVSNVYELAGIGNEKYWPTINSPGEMARHRIEVNLHSSEKFYFIGSGTVNKTKEKGDVQQWVLDTEREVDSASVMFALLPSESVKYQERFIEGVKIKLLAFKGVDFIDRAFKDIESSVKYQVERLGQLPLTELSVLLTGKYYEYTFPDEAGAYYGGVISNRQNISRSLSAVYFGKTLLFRTYRDKWLGAAICEWLRYRPYRLIDDNFKSGILGDRTVVSTGFDRRTYWEGIWIMATVSKEIGGDDRMYDFLKHFYKKYIFKTVTTTDFIRELKEFSGVDMNSKFAQWINNGVLFDLSGGNE